MKKSIKIVVAVTTMLITATSLIAIQSCKKNQNKLLDTQNVQNIIQHPENIENVNAYLKDFGEKMLNSKGNAMLTLEEASWHLTAYQNYSYGDVDYEYDEIIQENKEYSISVTDGMVSLSDLATLYSNTVKDIVQFYKGANLENKRVMYVITNIESTGRVTMEIALTYRDNNTSKYYYFDTLTSMFCATIFPEPLGYTVCYDAPVALTQQMLNFGPPSCSPYIGHRVYYIDITTPTFTYLTYPAIMYHDIILCHDILTTDEMCELLDGYLGIMMWNVPSGQEPFNCYVGVADDSKGSDPNYPPTKHHTLTCYYGCPVHTDEPVD